MRGFRWYDGLILAVSLLAAGYLFLGERAALVQPGGPAPLVRELSPAECGVLEFWLRSQGQPVHIEAGRLDQSEDGGQILLDGRTEGGLEFTWTLPVPPKELASLEAPAPAAAGWPPDGPSSRGP